MGIMLKASSLTLFSGKSLQIIQVQLLVLLLSILFNAPEFTTNPPLPRRYRSLHLESEVPDIKNRP